MKLAVISDIHANIYALKTVLEKIDEDHVDSIICLGDLVGYGPHPNETIALIRNRNILCIKGNYDTSVVDNAFSFIKDNTFNSFSLPWTVNELRSCNRYYLSNLPDSITLKINGRTLLFVHGSPKSVNEYVYEDSDIFQRVISEFQGDVLFNAHTHLPFIKEWKNKYFINDGSVGKPKIGRPNSTYCIINIENSGKVDVSIKETPYDYDKVVKDMKLQNFPLSLIDTYIYGRE
ncbi:metallophosphoesterase family protein [Clostridium oryzae]|uniref:Phosphoesterase n=1 Tax=Clostridium oryzae TaxID=1450648 RepID=A0A1V4ICU7_9CLOT|nr:metallophosphoesterase family protein [Clostridium oryzae]OPJ57766.1 phosphodiesterase [Clostridium oryzae]